MPNHVANRITGPSLDTIKQLLRTSQSVVDFNALIPMPLGLTIKVDFEVIDLARLAMRDLPDVNEPGIEGMIAKLTAGNMVRSPSPIKLSDERWAMFIQCLENKRRWGEYYWYDWACKNWGTKWNAYAIVESADSLYFETAWACPEPIVKALAAALKVGEFTWEYASEDYGNNLGIWTWRDSLLSKTEPEGDLEAWAAKLHGHTDEEIAEMRAERAADLAEEGAN
jgi:hypothetical protein